MKRVVLNQITLCADGSIGLQWLKGAARPRQGGALSEPHRSAMAFDGDADGQIGAVCDHPRRDGAIRSRPRRSPFKAIVGKVDAIGKADTDISARRQAKIAAKEKALAV